MDESYQLRSKIHFQREDFISALYDLQTALILNPASSETLRWQKLAGRNLLNKGHKVFQEDLNQAIEQYELSLMFNSQDPEAYYWRGVAYSRLSRLDLAVADLEKAIELNPHHFDSYLALDYTLFQKQELDRIIEHWNRFIKLEPDHPRAYLERSGTYYHKKDFVNSLRDLKKSCDLGNKEACKRYGRYKNQRAN
jgi:tetratricopeptide (TPR) repeat protein